MIGSCAGTARVIALLLDAVGPAPLCAALAAVSGLDQSALERRLVRTDDSQSQAHSTPASQPASQPAS
jgi:hypothetical protein